MVVFQERAYGALVSSFPRLTLSSLNCTPATLTLSEAFAETVMVPETVVPVVGAVRDAVGPVVSEAACAVVARTEVRRDTVKRRGLKMCVTSIERALLVTSFAGIGPWRGWGTADCCNSDAMVIARIAAKEVWESPVTKPSNDARDATTNKILLV